MAPIPTAHTEAGPVLALAVQLAPRVALSALALLTRPSCKIQYVYLTYSKTLQTFFSFFNVLPQLDVLFTVPSFKDITEQTLPPLEAYIIWEIPDSNWLPQPTGGQSPQGCVTI